MIRAIGLFIKSHPKIFGGILVGVLLAGSLWYLDHRKDEYEKQISTLQADLKDSEQSIKDQKAEMDSYKIRLSTKITEQQLALSEARREAQERIKEKDERIKKLMNKKPENYSDDNCEASEMLIDDMLGLK